MGPPSPDKVQQLAKNLLATKYVTVVSFVILLHEHIVTLPLEIERIWKQPRSLASLLFCLNRYGTLCQLVVLLFAYNQSWSERVCSSWFRFAPGLCVISIGFAECILILRTYALYCRDKLVLLGLVILFGAEMGIMGYCVSIATHLRLLPPFVGCIPIGRMPMGVAFYVAPLLTDSVIFVLTVIKTARYLRTNVRTALPRIVLRDGVLYFVLIVLINLMNVIVYIFAPVSLMALGASFSQVLTTILISRLQLNLLGESLRRTRAQSQRPDYSNAKQLSIEMRQVAIGSFSQHEPPPPPPPVFSSRNLARMFNAPPSAVLMGGPLMATSFPPPPSMGGSLYYPSGPVFGSRSVARTSYPSSKKRWCEEPEGARLRHEDSRTEPQQMRGRQRDSRGTTSSRILDHNVKATTKTPWNNPTRTDHVRLTRDAALSNRPSVPVSRVDLDGWHSSTSLR
ncbi:hypothetical protein M407DRAFT_23716 [Tulasnella calospora MUT 4182]|uniref:DUF6533 domain-containing protein n=1 Tax=Tulasnella calospora MUT 4182 TaxID=1051891 RepID=A0A0C3QJ43_9AGAM|nr:hypothetical protein M407DRAFT_23716 [Tulasnella calospora MUT 4182]